MNRPGYLLASAAVLALTLPGVVGAGARSGPGSPGARWTIDDVVLGEEAADFQPSPDGRYVVWVKTAMNKDEGERISHLYRTDLETGREVRLTRGKHGCASPRWSPDGRLLAFLSDRPTGDDDEDEDDAVTQLWVMDVSGGEPWPLTTGKRAVKSHGWAGSDALVFTAQEEPTWRERSLKKDKKDKTQVVEDDRHEPPVRLFRVKVKDKTVTRLSDNPDRIDLLAVSPDGRHLVARHARSLRYTYDNRDKPTSRLYDLEAGTSKAVLASPKLNVGAFLWKPDGSGFLAVDEHTSQPQLAQAAVLELWEHDVATGRESKVDLGWDNGLAREGTSASGPALAASRDGFFALLAAGAHCRLAHYRPEKGGWQRSWLTGEHAGRVIAIQATPDGRRLFYAHSTASVPTQWYHAPLEGDKLVAPTKLAGVNEHLEKKTKARTEVVRWKGALDEEVEGILYYPHGYEKGKKYPLVVMIHGGPASLDLDSWDESWAYAANLYCQRGACVLKPNYHGSSNYGLKWLESITGGRYGELEVVDIERGVDHLIGRGLADPDRLALLGWSNGAILTNILTTLTTRYRAAASGAGNIEYVSDWANCEFGDAFDRFYLGKSPLEDPQLYLRKSPFYRLEKVRTPTVIFFGAEDRVVPVQQGWMQYRGLQQLGKTEVRFVLFPEEEHSLAKLAHQRRKLEEELAWMDRHLFGTHEEKNPALKPGSPLASAVELARAARVAGRRGLQVKGRLVPETVRHAGIEVGRFEVTCAQFAELDPSFRVEPGRENHPVSGVTFEQARRYCAELSRLTGEQYRLPRAEEAEKLYEEDEGKENTLDHWAGYAVNPDDARRLAEVLGRLPGPAPLLRPVGSFPGRGEEVLVFDLGGNAAEWVEGEDGKGVLRGGSADRPADEKQADNRAAPEYRGFRVVRER